MIEKIKLLEMPFEPKFAVESTYDNRLKKQTEWIAADSRGQGTLTHIHYDLGELKIFLRSKCAAILILSATLEECNCFPEQFTHNVMTYHQMLSYLSPLVEFPTRFVRIKRFFLDLFKSSKEKNYLRELRRVKEL